MRSVALLWLYVSVAVTAGLPRPRWAVGALLSKPDEAGTAGETACAAASHRNPQAVLGDFLQAHSSEAERRNHKSNFHIQGWRWHTLSLIREGRRLERFLSPAARKTDDSQEQQAVVDYVVDFNMRGLHQIEGKLFFPWVRQQISDRAPTHIAQAFGTIMDQLEDQRLSMAAVGQTLVRHNTDEDSDRVRPNKPTQCPHAHDVRSLSLSLLCLLYSILQRQSVTTQSASLSSQQAAQLVAHAQSMLETEEDLLVPLVAHFVPSADQKSFNSQVIRSLGLWDSRLHLVSMHEAVWALPDRSERLVFETEIPYLARQMIPRWKRLLYEPRVGALQDVP
jgi:hypothetical protein